MASTQPAMYPSGGPQRSPGERIRWAEWQRAATPPAQERLAQALGWFSLGLGLSEVLSPGALGGMLGIRNHKTLTRVMGMREITAGVGILSQRRPTGWVWGRVAGDALDLALLGAAAIVSSKRGRVAAAAAAVAGVTALDIASSLQLTNAPIRTLTSVAVNRSPEDCYRFWRDFNNLSRFMTNVESVRATGERTSHWSIRTPAGLTAESDAELTEDTPNERIAWRSLPGSDVQTTGTVSFEPGPAGRGAIIRIDMEYTPPAGRAGALVVKLFGADPGQQSNSDLRRFKQLMEAGEIATIEGQPSGPRSAPRRMIERLIEHENATEEMR
jgi:uncharacterized membrane protein